MGVGTKHPLYLDRAREWSLVRHAARGEEAIKAEAQTYLPMPTGFSFQTDGGTAMYSAYMNRAQFPELLGPTIRGMVGIIHRTEAQIEMPTQLEYIWEKSTKDGLSLEALHRRITTELLTTGRYGLLVDADGNGSEPYFATYTAESIINWSDDRTLIVLDETALELDGFDWKPKPLFRGLFWEDGAYVVRTYTDANAARSEGVEVRPQGEGRRELSMIPFVMVGSDDLTFAPDDPPLLGVARACKAIYQLDADYRHQLFMTGQETLVVINGEAPEAVGAGVVLVIKAPDGEKADVKYVGPNGVGISAHRTAIQDERQNAITAGSRVFDQPQMAQESGEAREMRMGAQLSTLTTIAQASALGLEQGLRHIARMKGLDPESVIVKPNLDHLRGALSPSDAESLMRLWQGGAISYETLYDRLQRGEVASAERDAEEEAKLIDEETSERDLNTDPLEDGEKTGDPAQQPGGSAA